LDLGTKPYHCIARDVDQWKRGSGGHLQASGNLDEVAGFDGAQLSVGTPCDSHDAVARLETGDALSCRDNGASEVEAGDVGERYRYEVFDGARAYPPISGVDAGGCDAHEHRAFGGSGVWDIFIGEI